MHKMLLLIDENFEVLGKDRMKWDKLIQTQIDRYYTFNGFCDDACVGGRYCKALTCKPGKGLVNTYVDPKWSDRSIEEKENGIYDPAATRVDVCAISDLTKPLNIKRLHSIETTKGGSTIEYTNPKFKKYIDRINKKEFDGLLVVLDIHF